MTKGRENNPTGNSVLAKLNQTENKPSAPRTTNLMPTRPPLTSSTSENLMNLACQGPEDLHKPGKENVVWNRCVKKPLKTDVTTADWSMKVNQAQAKMAEAEDTAWLDRLPRQLSPPSSPVFGRGPCLGRKLSA